MAITVNIYYTGENGNAKKFAEEMVASGIVDEIQICNLERVEKGIYGESNIQSHL